MATGCDTSEVTYIVPGITRHSEKAVSNGLLASPSVQAVVVDLETRGVTVHGHRLDCVALRDLIENAGYEAA